MARHYWSRLFLHTRTLLAPFLAVHADLAATLAALEAWRLSGRHFSLCLATLILGSLPVGVPVVLLLLGSLSVSGVGLGAAPTFAWVVIQAIRPVLVPSVYALFCDLWDADGPHQVCPPFSAT